MIRRFAADLDSIVLERPLGMTSVHYLTRTSVPQYSQYVGLERYSTVAP